MNHSAAVLAHLSPNKRVGNKRRLVGDLFEEIPREDHELLDTSRTGQSRSSGDGRPGFWRRTALDRQSIDFTTSPSRRAGPTGKSSFTALERVLVSPQRERCANSIYLIHESRMRSISHQRIFIDRAQSLFFIASKQSDRNFRRAKNN